jgi:hypothetical protein
MPGGGKTIEANGIDVSQQSTQAVDRHPRCGAGTGENRLPH